MAAHVVAVAVMDAVPVFEFAVPCEVFGIDRSDIVTPWYDFRLCAAEPETAEGSSRNGLPGWNVKDKGFAWERPLRRSDLDALGDSAP